MMDSHAEKQTIVFWGIDIVWIEEIREALRKKKIVCEEADSREELYEIMRKEPAPVLFVLSQQALEEAFSSMKKGILELGEDFDAFLAVVLEEDDASLELEALRAGAHEVLFRERKTEIATERILLLLRKREWGKADWSGKKKFDREFSEIHLTKLEKQVLYELYQKENQVVSRQELMKKFWKERENAGARVVDTIIKQLRKKLQDTSYQIQGIYGKGYLLKK